MAAGFVAGLARWRARRSRAGHGVGARLLVAVELAVLVAVATLFSVLHDADARLAASAPASTWSGT